MDKTTWWQRHKPTKRRIIQIYAAILYNCHVKGFVKGNIYTGNTKALCVPGLNCYSCPGAVGACPLGALQNAVASSNHRLPWYIFGIVMLYGLLLGRTICGYLCPFGLIEELLFKLPTKKIKKNKVTKLLSNLKYVILAIFVIAIPLYYCFKNVPLPAFCKYICPAGTLEGAVGLLANPANKSLFSMLGALFTNKLIILLIVIVTCIFVFRAFCRFLCPLGALYGLFSRFSLMGVTVDSKCNGCKACIAQCKMDVSRVGDHECIHCGECVAKCPANAISVTFAGKKIKPVSPKIRLTIGIILLGILVGTILYVNRPGKGSVSEDNVGSLIKTDIPEELIAIIGTEDKPVILNFWATWCTPCIAELPYFEELFMNYGDGITIVAVHSNLVTDDIDSYIEDCGYTMPFALDENGSIIEYFGGGTMLPMTVILDKDGNVTYNSVGSVTYEFLDVQAKSLLR